MAQHSGGIRRPRKSYLISLLPISHFHSPFSFIHTSILSFPFFSFFGPLTFLLFPFLRIFSFLLRFAFFFSLSYFSHPLAILPTRTLSVSLRSTLDFAHAFATLSLSFLLIHTRIHAASAQPSMHSLARSFSRHFNIFFFLLFLHSFLFVRRSERLYIFTGILLVVVYSPPSRGNVSSSHHLYLFLFLLLPFPFLFHFVLFVSFKHRQVRYRITIVINFFLFCLLLIWSSNRTSSNPCVLTETRLDYEFRFTYTCCLCVCLPLCSCMRVFVCMCVCACVCKRCDERHLGRPACLRAEPPNSLELFAYRRKKREKVRR